MERRKFVRNTSLFLAGLPFTSLWARQNSIPVLLFSKHLHWLELERMFRTAARLGFDGIDLTVRRGGHIEMADAVKKLPLAVELGKKYKIPVTALTTGILKADGPFTEEILKTMKLQGLNKYRMGFYKYDLDRSIREQIEEFKVQFKELAELNKRYGITGYYENHAGNRSLGAPLWDLEKVLNSLDPTFIGCQFDIRHATVENTNSWPLTFRYMREYIHCVSIKDFVFINEKNKTGLRNVPLGEGVVDLNKLILLIRKFNMTIPLTMHFEYPLGGADKGNRKIEVEPDHILKALKKDLEYLRSIIES